MSWVAQKAGGSVRAEGERQRITVPNLEPGDYQLCAGAVCVAAYVPRLATASVTWPE